MPLAALDRIKSIFTNSSDDSERRELFKEVLLMALARAAHADSNVSPVEVETVREIVKRETGDDVSEADVRLAAASEIFEQAPLTTYLSAVSRSLSSRQRSVILAGLLEAIRKDTRVTASEVDFFDMVAGALRATPAEIAGLTGDG